MNGLIAGQIEIAERNERRISWTRVPWATALAATVAVAATASLYFAASAGGLVDGRVILPSLVGMGPLSLASVAVTAALAIVGAGVLLGLLAVTTRRPVTIFRIVATALGVASLSMPATIPGPSTAMRLTMAGMHVVVWAVSVGVLATLAGRPVQGVS
jgi:hypothetical protein